MKLKNRPNLIEIREALDAFDENNIEELEKLIARKYKLTKTDIKPLELRIAGAFIKNEANIFSNRFIRTVREEKFDFTVLDEAEKRAERIYHLFKRAAILITMGTGDPLLDSVKSPHFEVLTPLQYHHEGMYWFFNSDEGIYIFETVAFNNQKIVKTYLSQKKYEQVLSEFDSSEDGLKVDAELLGNEYVYVPIIEWRSPNIDNIVINPVIGLEQHFIKQLTWGLDNADPKLLNQTILKSDEGIETIKGNLSNYGKNRKIMKIGLTEDISIFGVGDISVLKDLFTIRAMAVEELALTRGVDVSAVIRTTQALSGESKRMDLGYINRIRNDYKIPARNFDKRIFNLLKENYKIDCGWENFITTDIELDSDKETERAYAVNMRSAGFWTNAEAVSYVRQVSVEDAEQFIKDNGLEPDIGQIQ